MNNITLKGDGIKRDQVVLNKKISAQYSINLLLPSSHQLLFQESSKNNRKQISKLALQRSQYYSAQPLMKQPVKLARENATQQFRTNSQKQQNIDKIKHFNNKCPQSELNSELMKSFDNIVDDKLMPYSTMDYYFKRQSFQHKEQYLNRKTSLNKIISEQKVNTNNKQVQTSVKQLINRVSILQNLVQDIVNGKLQIYIKFAEKDGSKSQKEEKETNLLINKKPCVWPMPKIQRSRSHKTNLIHKNYKLRKSLIKIENHQRENYQGTEGQKKKSIIKNHNLRINNFHIPLSQTKNTCATALAHMKRFQNNNKERLKINR